MPCAPPAAAQEAEPADLILTNGRVYTFTWGDPAPDGTPAPDAPHDATGWHPDAEAVAMRGEEIAFVGSAKEAEAYRSEATRVLDLAGATVLPGLVDAHVHTAELGKALTQVNLEGVETEEEAVARVAERARSVPEGEWIVGWGWDEGAWADRHPTVEQLSEAVPDHPVYLKSLHGFAVWGNRLAFRRAGVTQDTQAPSGGEILRDAEGRPSGVLLNRAVTLLEEALPPPTLEEKKRQVVAGLEEMVRSGYVAVHQAGADSLLMAAFETLDARERLPVRVYAMLSGRDKALLARWAARGPRENAARGARLTVRAVKMYYDGALGSRGALLLADYADQPGHRGIGDAAYGFDTAWARRMMEAGFQLGIHAIGDAANRQTLDFFERAYTAVPGARQLRHRIEHAQVLHPDDFGRLADLGLIASMQPPHAVEDKTWAEERLGPERIQGAYAWRRLRQAGADLVFSSDLAGSDHSIFYGLHAAVTRRDKALEPQGGWYAGQGVTPEEAVRAYTTWAAYAGFAEDHAGTIAPGRRADLTVVDLDPLALSTERYGDILNGAVRMTVVGGEVAYAQDEEQP